MRSHLDLPDDLPRPGAPIRHTPFEKAMRESRYVTKGIWEDPGTGRWECYIPLPGLATPSDVAMLRADGDHAWANRIEARWEKEGRAAEDEAIAKLDTETQDAEARFKASAARGATPINYANVIDYLTELARVLDEQNVPQHGRMWMGMDPGGFMETALQCPLELKRELTAVAVLQRTREAERRMIASMYAPRRYLTSDFE